MAEPFKKKSEMVNNFFIDQATGLKLLFVNSKIIMFDLFLMSRL